MNPLLLFTSTNLEKVTPCAFAAILTFLIIFAVISDIQDKQSSQTKGYSVDDIHHAGHQYLLFRDYNRVGVTHDPDCPCQE